MKNQNQSMNKPLEFEENDSSWDSFVEIISSGLRVGLFCGCIYILKEICVLGYEMHCWFDNQPINCVVIELITAGILIILAIAAFIVMHKN